MRKKNLEIKPFTPDSIERFKIRLTPHQKFNKKNKIARVLEKCKNTNIRASIQETKMIISDKLSVIVDKFKTLKKIS